ncbi:MAG TPA: hypothetical protein ENH82_10080 [bacterium]|nr:hypothetical protein [bacterium]
MVQIYNATEETYSTIEEYITAYDADDTDVYYVKFLYELSALFDKAKKQTALRWKNAKDENGNSLLLANSITVDEEDFVDDAMERGSGELFKKLLLPWAKNIFNSYQYGVDGIIDIVQSTPGFTQIQDLEATFITNELVDEWLEISSGTYEGEDLEVLSNSPTVINLTGNFTGDVTGASYFILNYPRVLQKFLEYFISMPDYPYLDLLESVEVNLEKANVLYVIKEYYLTTRLMEDYQIENTMYNELVKEIKSTLMMQTQQKKVRRGFFKDYNV